MKNFINIIIFSSVASLIQSNTLDELGLKFGTDKSSLGHYYTKIYEKYFESIKEKPIKFLEIGFAEGKSARMWENYFSNAQLFFIDVNQNAYQHMQGLHRTDLYMVNQEDANQLLNFIKVVGRDFDIIIDDGGHTMNQQIVSFKTLFPFIKSGGVYIIEDLHTSYPYEPNYAYWFGCTNPEKTTVRFLQNLIHNLNYVGAKTTCADFNKCPQELLSQLSSYEKDIESIHFYTSLCFIFKR